MYKVPQIYQIMSKAYPLFVILNIIIVVGKERSSIESVTYKTFNVRDLLSVLFMAKSNYFITIGKSV